MASLPITRYRPAAPDRVGRKASQVSVPNAAQDAAIAASAVRQAIRKTRQRPVRASKRGKSSPNCGLIVSSPSAMPAATGRRSSRPSVQAISAATRSPFCPTPSDNSTEGVQKAATMAAGPGITARIASAKITAVAMIQAIHAQA
jgi:hypothetical protein